MRSLLIYCYQKAGSRRKCTVRYMPSELDAASSDPLYQQVVDDIKRDIASGLYLPGERIPTEIELGDIYRISRITVRRAVKELVKEGLLIKRQGKGTFVNASERGSAIQNQDLVQSFSRTCELNGVVPGARLVTRGLVSLPSDDGGFFGETEDCRAIQVKRVRTADGVPLMIEDNYFDPDRYGFLIEEELSDRSLFDLIEERTGLVPRNGDACVLSMERAYGEMSSLLEVPDNEPLFSVRGEYSDQYGHPMFIGIQHVVGKHYSFRL